jgi:hypothetical protein
LTKGNIINSRDSLKAALQDTRNATIKTYITSLSKENHTIWKATKQFKKPITHVTPILQEDGNWRKTDKEKATAFAEYLSNVFTTSQTNDNNNNTENIVKTFLDSACPMTLPITPFSPTEVKVQINKCNSHKAPGFDFITGQVLKELPRKAVVLLTTIYNSILRFTYFPVPWKFDQIIIIHKPRKPPNRVTPFRPINLLLIKSKIFKIIFHKRILMDDDINKKVSTH